MTKKAKEIEKKFRKAEFDMEDMLEQFKTIKKMGSIGNVLGMIPGMSMLSKKMPTANVDDKAMARVEAIILSMTKRERRKPEIINGSRRKRIAMGSGTTPAEVNRLLTQYEEMRKMMKRLQSGRTKHMTDSFMRQLGGGR